MKYIYLVLASCLLSFTSYADNVDSLDISTDLEKHFMENLDQMTRLWYIENMPEIDSIDYNYTPADSLPVSVTDSILLERIKNISSVVDLSYNNFVRNFIKVYTDKKRDRVEIMLGLTRYYFPLFEEILDQYDLPLELKYLAIIESALNPKATSRVGAAGLWQFMYATGRQYKLEINSLVDERRDPIKSTHAAAQFTTDLYRIYGDWILVIAAYNCGPGNVNKAIRRSGGRRNYWEMYYYLPRETRGYVPAFIAATYVMNYYKEHNLKPREIAFPFLTDTLEIHEELHLKQVAEVLNIPIKQLRDLNPQYRYDVIPAKRKTYALNIPIEYTGSFISMQDSIFNHKDKEFFDPSKLVVKPSSRYAYKGTPPPNSSKLYYKVKSGDNLGFIADWYDVGVSQVRYWNGVRRNLIRVGQKLVIYVPKSKVNKYKSINTMSFAEKQKQNGNTKISQSTSNKNFSKPNDNSYIYYKVRRGDTLWEIAQKYTGVSATDIKQLNKLNARESIVPGQYLKIKPKV